MRRAALRRLIGALHPAETAGEAIAQGEVTLAGVQSEPIVFAALIPTPADYATHLGTFSTTNQKSNVEKPGGAGIRDAAWLVAIQDREKILAFIQPWCDANPTRAHEMFDKLGMLPLPRTVRVKAPYAVDQGLVSGTADTLIKSPGRRYSVEHRASGDQGKTFPFTGSSLDVHFQFKGLTPGVSYQFQSRVTVKANKVQTVLDWSQTITLTIK